MNWISEKRLSEWEQRTGYKRQDLSPVYLEFCTNRALIEEALEEPISYLNMHPLVKPHLFWREWSRFLRPIRADVSPQASRAFNLCMSQLRKTMAGG